MKRRESGIHLIFNEVLIVYKYFNTEAISCAQKILSYILSIDKIHSIYTEEVKSFEEIYKKYLCDNKYSDDEKEKNGCKDIEELVHEGNRKKLKLFVKEDHASLIDLVIVVGGDGTVLWSSSLFTGYRKPYFLNFNLGTLGYLVYYKCDEYKKVLDELLFNEKKVISFETRSSLDVTFVSEDEYLKKVHLNCLNDVVFEKGSNTHMIKTEIKINDEDFTQIRSDGVLIATSTGSTAYSLSTGGSIVHYDVDALILNAICPHTLSFRPIIFTKGVSIKLILDESCVFAQVGNDGISSYRIKAGEGIEVKLSNFDLKIIILDNLIDSPMINWKNKLLNQLGWNSSFKNG